MKEEKYPEKWMSPKVKVVESPIHGKGMFAIAAGSIQGSFYTMVEQVDRSVLIMINS